MASSNYKCLSMDICGSKNPHYNLADLLNTTKHSSESWNKAHQAYLEDKKSNIYFYIDISDDIHTETTASTVLNLRLFELTTIQENLQL